MSRLLWVVVLMGLAIRLVLAPFTSWSPDFGPWLSRVEELYHGIALYQSLTFSYPPLFAHTIALFTFPAVSILGSSHVGVKAVPLQLLSYNSQLISADIPHPLILLTVKLPMILSDVGTALVLAKLVRQQGGSARRAELVAAAWLLNPLAIWVGAVHGQFDPIPAFLTVLALGQAWQRQWMGVGLALSLGILFKLYPVYLLPSFAAFALFDDVLPRDDGTPVRVGAAIKNLASMGVGLAIPIVIFAIPLLGTNALTAVFSRTETSSVGSGLDLWFPTILPPFRLAIYPIAKGYGIVLLGILYSGLILVLWRARRVWRGRRELAQLETVIAVLALVLLTSPSTNPQFLVWILPFLILSVAFGSRRLVATVTLSVIPVLFYLAQLGGNMLGMLTPAITYYSWPVSAQSAATSLTASFGRVGPLAIPLRQWMMLVVAAWTVLFLLLIVIPVRLVRPLATRRTG